MSYYPILLELSGAPCLIAGGGALGLRKAKTLLDCGAEVTVADPDPCSELADLPITLLRRKASPEDVEGMLLVVDATGSEEARRMLSRACKEKQILFNSACGGEKGTAVFPAVAQRGRTVLAVSSQGASPLVSAYLRDTLATRIPEGIDAILDAMAAIRPRARAEFADQQSRGDFLHRCLQRMLDLARPLYEGELEAVLRGMKEKTDEFL